MVKKDLEIQELYDGSQLRSLFGFLEHGVLGDSLLYWVGPCRVALDHMVDGEDLLAENKIEADEMLHLIVEIFERDLFSGACFQRLMTSNLMQMVVERSYELDLRLQIERRGDDLYVDGGKMNVSVATLTPSSCLIHFGVNVSRSGTPVKTFSINDLQWTVDEFKEAFTSRVCNEYGSVKKSIYKVRWVQ